MSGIRYGLKRGLNVKEISDVLLKCLSFFLACVFAIYLQLALLISPFPIQMRVILLSIVGQQ